ASGAFTFGGTLLGSASGTKTKTGTILTGEDDADINVDTATASTTVGNSDTTPPTVTIDSLTGSSGTDSSSPFAVLTNGGTTITWHATENGSFTVRLGGTNCTNGTQVASGSYSSSPNSVSTSIAAADLAVSSNTLRVCVTDAATPTPNTGASENVTVTKDTTAPTVTIDSTNPSTINSAGNSTIIWHASENGTYSVRKRGPNCSDGTQLSSGTYPTSPNTTNVTINGRDLTAGANTIRTPQTD